MRISGIGSDVLFGDDFLYDLGIFYCNRRQKACTGHENELDIDRRTHRNLCGDGGECMAVPGDCVTFRPESV